MKLNLSIFVCLSTLLLSACDPRFKTSTEICSTNQNEKVFVSRLNHTVKASDDEYRPYLEDILTAFQVTGEVTEEQQTALDEITTIIKQYMPYEIIDGEIESTNALDLLESMIATTDAATKLVTDEGNGGEERNDSKLIEAFTLAKRQVASGISADNGFCIYTNTNITIENYVTQTKIDEETGEAVIDEETNKEVKIDVLVNILKVISLSLTYDPFNGTFGQNIIMKHTNTDSNDPDNGIVTNLFGFYDAPPNDFLSVGYTAPTVRVGSVNNTEKTKSLTTDDDFDKQLGQIEHLVTDEYCSLKDSDGEDYVFTGNTALIVDGSNELFFAGDILTINRNEANEHTLSIDDHNILIDEKALTFNTLTVNTSEPIENYEGDSNDPVFIANNILTIDLSKTNGLVIFQDNALFIDGVKQLDNDGGTLLIRANTGVIDVEGKALIIDDAFVYGLQEQTIAVNCPEGTATRTIQKNSCKGGGFDSDPQPNKLNNEVGKRKTQDFDLNTDLTALKRFRIETDYPNNTVKVYASKYNQAIYDIDGETLILDPTPCEQQAVLNDLFLEFPVEEREADDFEGVRLTLIPDSGYDFVFELNTDGSAKTDDSGAGIIDETQLPEPVYTFTGTAIPTRQ